MTDVLFNLFSQLLFFGPISGSDVPLSDSQLITNPVSIYLICWVVSPL